MISEEEKKAIEEIRNWRNYIVKNRKKVNRANDIEFHLRTVLNLIEKQQDIINRIEKYAKGVDDKELLLIVKASNQINDLFYKCKKGGLLDE